MIVTAIDLSHGLEGILKLFPHTVREKNLRSCWILFPHRIIQWKKFLL